MFGPDGVLYVTSVSSDPILRYDATTGSFLGALDPAHSAGMVGASFLSFNVPEPSSPVLVGCCGALLLAICRHRR